jgi:phosphate transport system substrate-binding protein
LIKVLYAFEMITLIHKRKYNSSMKLTGILVLIALALVLVLVPVGCQSNNRLQGTINEDGSLNVQPLANKLADFFIARYPRVTITVNGSSTAAGIEAVNAGKADLGGASRDLKPSEPQLIAHLLARDGIAIIVHPGNPVSSLTRDQVRDIFAGKISNWQQVGGEDRDIHIFTREAATSTRTVLEEILMGNDPISAAAIVRLNNDEQKKAVIEDPQAIGYNPFATSLDGSVKALAIDRAAASPDNARNGIYPLVRPLYFLTRTAPEGLVKAFVDFCLGSEGQQIAGDLGYVRVK